jgi:hypothetical protein
MSIVIADHHRRDAPPQSRKLMPSQHWGFATLPEADTRWPVPIAGIARQLTPAPRSGAVMSHSMTVRGHYPLISRISGKRERDGL